MAKRKTHPPRKGPRPLTFEEQQVLARALPDWLPHFERHRATWAEAAFFAGKKLSLEVPASTLRKIARALGLDWPHGETARPTCGPDAADPYMRDMYALVSAVAWLYFQCGERVPTHFDALAKRVLGGEMHTLFDGDLPPNAPPLPPNAPPTPTPLSEADPTPEPDR